MARRSKAKKGGKGSNAEILHDIIEAIRLWNPDPPVEFTKADIRGRADITPELRRAVHPKKTAELVAGAEKTIRLMAENLSLLKSMAEKYGFQDNLNYIFEMLQEAGYVNLSAIPMLGEAYWNRWLDFVFPRENAFGTLFSFDEYLNFWAIREDNAGNVVGAMQKRPQVKKAVKLAIEDHPRLIHNPAKLIPYVLNELQVLSPGYKPRPHFAHQVRRCVSTIRQEKQKK